jgi:hypothetical protein
MTSSDAAGKDESNSERKTKTEEDISLSLLKSRGGGAQLSVDEGNSSGEYEVAIGNEHQNRHRPC